jgi:hypothetical protein
MVQLEISTLIPLLSVAAGGSCSGWEIPKIIVSRWQIRQDKTGNLAMVYVFPSR